MNKKELLTKFNTRVKSNYCNDCKDCNNCNSCKDCNNCYDCNNYCNSCNNCYNCYNCYNCNDCILCYDISDKTSGYWLLNKEVTEEEFNVAKKELGYDVN